MVLKLHILLICIIGIQAMRLNVGKVDDDDHARDSSFVQADLESETNTKLKELKNNSLF